MAASELPKENKYYNPKALITGFDLDAVVAMNLQPLPVSVIDNEDTFEYDKIIIYDILGRNAGSFKDASQLLNLLNGQYILLYISSNQIIKREFYIR